MSSNSILGLISSLALFLPICLIFVSRLTSYRTFFLLTLYYFSLIIHTLMSQGFVHSSPQIIHYWGIGNNIIDAPLMLTFLTYFSGSTTLTRRMRILTVAFLVFEIAVLAWKGFTVEAITIIMAPGLCLVFLFSLYFFVRQTKVAMMHRKATGKAMMSAALLFAYGCYSIIYLMYYVFKPEKPDPAMTKAVFLIYFVVTTISSLLMSGGIMVEKKRVQKLAELKLTRKELAVIYKDSKKSSNPPLNPAKLDFDKEQWT